jgi:hypothetical protein
VGFTFQSLLSLLCFTFFSALRSPLGNNPLSLKAFSIADQFQTPFMFSSSQLILDRCKIEILSRTTCPREVIYTPTRCLCLPPEDDNILYQLHMQRVLGHQSGVGKA